MKRINALLSLVIMLAFFVSNADKCYAMEDSDTSYRPFVEDGKSWVVTTSYAHGWWAPVMAECYYIDGDTLVGAQPCKKLMLRTNDIENHVINTSLNMLIYEQDKKVYGYLASDEGIMEQPILFYDFAASPRDTLSLGGIYEAADVSENRIFQIWDTPQLNWHEETFNGQLATYYDPNLTEEDVFETWNCPLFRWFESIGATDHPFTKFRYDFTGVPYLLRDCRVGNKVIYTNLKDGPLFPDFTGDGLIDIVDVNQVIGFMLGKSDGEPTDATDDGRVDIADVNAVINAMLGKP